MHRAHLKFVLQNCGCMRGLARAALAIVAGCKTRGGGNLGLAPRRLRKSSTLPPFPAWSLVFVSLSRSSKPCSLILPSTVISWKSCSSSKCVWSFFSIEATVALFMSEKLLETGGANCANTSLAAASVPSMEAILRARFARTCQFKPSAGASTDVFGTVLPLREDRATALGVDLAVGFLDACVGVLETTSLGPLGTLLNQSSPDELPTSPVLLFPFLLLLLFPCAALSSSGVCST